MDKLLTSREVAARLKISQQRVIQMAHAGDLRGERYGLKKKFFRFRESEVARVEKERCIPDAVPG